MFDHTTRTLLCGDLFTQRGADCPPLTESDIVGPSEIFRQPLDYFAHGTQIGAILERLARSLPRAWPACTAAPSAAMAPAALRTLASSLTTA